MIVISAGGSYAGYRHMSRQFEQEKTIAIIQQASPGIQSAWKLGVAGHLEFIRRVRAFGDKDIAGFAASANKLAQELQTRQSKLLAESQGNAAIFSLSNALQAQSAFYAALASVYAGGIQTESTWSDLENQARTASEKFQTSQSALAGLITLEPAISPDFTDLSAIRRQIESKAKAVEAQQKLRALFGQSSSEVERAVQSMKEVADSLSQSSASLSRIEAIDRLKRVQRDLQQVSVPSAAEKKKMDIMVKQALILSDKALQALVVAKSDQGFSAPEVAAILNEGIPGLLGQLKAFSPETPAT